MEAETAKFIMGTGTLPEEILEQAMALRSQKRANEHAAQDRFLVNRNLDSYDDDVAALNDAYLEALDALVKAYKSQHGGARDK
jgi:hypothetical protein